MKNKKIIFSLLIVSILIFGTSCSNNLFGDPNKQNENLVLTEEQKTPEYAIENILPTLHQKNAAYKYLTIDDFLFVTTTGSSFEGVKTENGGFEFILPYDISIPMITTNTDTFTTVISMNNLNGKYSLSIGVSLDDVNQNTDFLKVFDNTGVDFSVLGDGVSYQKRWIKVLNAIPEDYKLFVENEGKSCEVLNKDIILEKESEKQKG